MRRFPSGRQPEFCILDPEVVRVDSGGIETEAPEMNSIVVPVDFSEVTDAVIAHVRRLAARAGLRIHLVHVIPTYATRLLDASHPQYERVYAANEMRREYHALHAVANDLRSTGCDVFPVLAEGRVVDRILQIIDETGADLVVIGSHGHNRFHDMLLGGVCESVLRGSEVPVTVVPCRTKQSRTPPAQPDQPREQDAGAPPDQP